MADRSPPFFRRWGLRHGGCGAGFRDRGGSRMDPSMGLSDPHGAGRPLQERFCSVGPGFDCADFELLGDRPSRLHPPGALEELL